eukprot:2459480-Rhodomonas_salina.1
MSWYPGTRYRRTIGRNKKSLAGPTHGNLSRLERVPRANSQFHSLRMTDTTDTFPYTTECQLLQTAGLTDKFLDHSRDLPSSPITHARSHALKHTEKAECPSVAKNTNRLLSQQDPSIAMMHSSRPTEKTDPSHCKSAQTEQAKVEDDMIDLTTCDGERAADNLSSEDVIVVDLLTESEDGSENTDFGEFYARRDDVNGNQGGQQRETDVETRPKSERKREN